MKSTAAIVIACAVAAAQAQAPAKPDLSNRMVNLITAAAQGGPDTSMFEGKKMPKFKMTTTTGKTLTNAKLHGKVAIFDFWATWCGPCKLTSPVMEKIYEKYKSRGLVVIGADGWEHDTPATSAKAIGYASEHHYTYTFTYGNDDLMKALKIQGIPTMLIVDKKGVIRKVRVGYDNDLQAQLEKILDPLFN